MQQNFYMIGRDKNRTIWRVLKIDRSDPSELNIWQDSATYSENECYDLLRRVDEGNKAIGGLKFVTTCYGIIGMIYCIIMNLNRLLFFFFSISRTYMFSSGYRVCEISGTLLHAGYYEKKEDWSNLWSYSICHYQK